MKYVMIFASIFILSILIANGIQFYMWQAVNVKIDEKDQIKMNEDRIVAVRKIWNSYKILYPEGKLLILSKMFYTIGAINFTILVYFISTISKHN